MDQQERALKKLESLTYELEATLDTIDPRQPEKLALPHEDWHDIQLQIINLRVTIGNIGEEG